MKCCKPNRNLFNPLAIPPDFDPPAESNNYFYRVMVEVFDNATDTYDGIRVDGVVYNANGNTMNLSDAAFQADLTDAGIIGSPNSVAGVAYGTNSDTSLPHDLFWVYCQSNVNIDVMYTFRGIPFIVPLVGGVYSGYSGTTASTAITDITQDYYGWYAQVPDDGGGTQTFIWYQFFSNNPMNTKWINNPMIVIDQTNIIGWTTTFVDDGGGNYTLTYSNLPFPIQTILIGSTPSVINFI